MCANCCCNHRHFLRLATRRINLEQLYLLVCLTFLNWRHGCCVVDVWCVVICKQINCFFTVQCHRVSCGLFSFLQTFNSASVFLMMSSAEDIYCSALPPVGSSRCDRSEHQQDLNCVCDPGWYILLSKRYSLSLNCSKSPLSRKLFLLCHI